MMIELKETLKDYQRYFQMSWYVWNYKRRRIRGDRILFLLGSGPAGEDLAARMIGHLAEGGELRGCRVVIACSKARREDLMKRGIDSRLGGVTFIPSRGAKKCLETARAGHVIADTPLPFWYLKKEGQTVTYLYQRVFGGETDRPPVGRYDKARAHLMAKEQRSCLMSDYLVCADERTKDILCGAFCLDNLYRGKFLPLESAPGDAAECLCRHILKGERVLPELSAAHNGKKNVLIYAGSLGRNGITTALMSLFERLDRTKRNYFMTFRSERLDGKPDNMARIPEDMGFLPIQSTGYCTYAEIRAFHRYFDGNDCGKRTTALVDQFYDRLYRRSFAGCQFDCVIHYNGYVRQLINLFLHAPCRRIIFVHNDMKRELSEKTNQHPETVCRAYREYDRVAAVTEDICPPVRELGATDDNLVVVNNCHDWRSVLERAEQPVALDETTDCTVSRERLVEILDSDDRKFITIGRFSAEKRHKMLMDAFVHYHSDRPDSWLIIIGGYGGLYEETLQYAAGLPCAERIVIIRSISNPMPILKRCDLFVLSSSYEGLGLVLLEADTLGIPSISTDIPGPRGFLAEHGGNLVPPDEDGVYRGMLDFDAGRIHAMHVDYEAYNRHALEQFESLLP